MQQTLDNITRYMTPEQIVKLISSVADMGAVTLATEDSRTNAVLRSLILKATTSGSPAAGIGTGIKVQAESGDETPSDVGALDFAFSDVAAGTEDSYLDILTRVAGAALAAVFRFRATGANRAIFTHANTADRTYTLPDADATLGGGLTVVRKTAETQVVNNSTTLVDDDTLKRAMAANDVIMFLLALHHIGSDAADLRFTFTVPAGAAIIWNHTGVPSTADVMTVNDAVTSSGSALFVGAQATTRSLIIFGLVANGANAGDLQFRWAQSTAAGVDTKVRTNSWLASLKV